MDLLGRTFRRDYLEKAPAAVVLGEEGRIVLVGRHPDPHDLRPIVLAPLQPPPAVVAYAVDSRRPALEVEHRLAGVAEPATREARHHLLERKPKVEHRVERDVGGGEDAVEGLGLGQGAGEAVEQESSAASETTLALPDQAEHRRVGNQLSTPHVLKGGREGRRVVAGIELGPGSKQVARREVTRTQPFEEGGLRSLACPRSA
jgi:hypothetical protein